MAGKEGMPYRVGVDKWLFFITMLLVVAGLVMVFSASAVVAQERFHSPYAYLGRQAIWVVAGMAALLVLMHIDVSRYNSPKIHRRHRLRDHAAAGDGLLLPRLAQYSSLDSLRRPVHLSAL